LKNSKELIQQRQDRILQLLRQKQLASVAELATHFHVTPATIRRDLIRLEKSGLIRRVHGGAVIISGPESEIPLPVRDRTNDLAKQNIAAKAIGFVNDGEYEKAIRAAMQRLKEELAELSAETPYGIPYRPHIWGAGWDIQRLGAEYYFLHKAFPDLFAPDLLLNALNFVLGCHPGSNPVSFASGVGAQSATTAYGINRADFSYTPGGVVSGTALIRPDFPELLEWPFLWQQTEYVLGGGSSHYMFLVLAAQQILGKK